MIVRERSFDGVQTRIERLGFQEEVNRLRQVLLKAEISVSGNVLDQYRELKQLISSYLSTTPEWIANSPEKKVWTKSFPHGEGRMCLMLQWGFGDEHEDKMDASPIRAAIVAGEVDVGIMIVPGDAIASEIGYPDLSFSSTIHNLRETGVERLPLLLIGLDPALAHVRR